MDQSDLSVRKRQEALVSEQPQDFVWRGVINCLKVSFVSKNRIHLHLEIWFAPNEITDKAFYPYLIDKTKTPEYSIERSDCTDMCIIRFHAGAPYEDIAFKISNREWDMSEKAGFKNLFDRGILRLYFRFKRFRYKR